ncbi:MAG: hypothetical protein RTU09_11175, partial [Candidatus Thorarchaeota archaeon]
SQTHSNVTSAFQVILTGSRFAVFHKDSLDVLSGVMQCLGIPCGTEVHRDSSDNLEERMNF